MSDSGISPSDDIKILIEFYKDNVAYQRHHEDIRFKSSQLIVALTAALIAAVKFTGGGVTNYAIASFIVLLGGLGITQVLKHTERADRHARIARAYRKKIGEIAKDNSGNSVEDIHDDAAQIHKNKAGLVYRLRARWFWLCMHVAIITVGFTLVVLQCARKL